MADPDATPGEVGAGREPQGDDRDLARQSRDRRDGPPGERHLGGPRWLIVAGWLRREWSKIHWGSRRQNVIILSCVAVIAVGGGLAKLLIPESKPIVSAEVPDDRADRINPILLRFAAEKLVEDHLRDPDSAIFSDETVALGRNGGSPIVCGWVNSRWP